MSADRFIMGECIQVDSWASATWCRPCAMLAMKHAGHSAVPWSRATTYRDSSPQFSQTVGGCSLFMHRVSVAHSYHVNIKTTSSRHPRRIPAKL